nr:hypothetical protein [Escherichia coli]
MVPLWMHYNLPPHLQMPKSTPSGHMAMAIYPVGLLIMMTGTLYFLIELIPVLSKISSPDSWSGALGFLYGLSLFVDITALYVPFFLQWSQV